MARRLAVLVSVLFGALGIIVAGALLWMASDSGARFISSELKTTVKQRTGIDISFERLGIDLFPPRIRVQKMNGSDKTGRFDCTIEETELSPSIFALISRSLAIEEVYLGSPRCTIRLGEKEVDALIHDDGNDKGAAPLNLEEIPDFEVIAMSNASFEVTISDPGRIGTVSARVDGLGVDVTKDDADMEIRGLLERLDVAWREGEREAAEQLLDLSFRAAVSEAGVDLRNLSLRLGEASLRLRDAHIPVPVWPDGPVVADLSLSTDLDLLNRLPLDLPHLKGALSYSGQLGVARDANGKLGVTAEGRVALVDGGIDDFVIGTLEAHIKATPASVSFDKSVLHAATGQLALAGSIALDQQLTTELRLGLDEVELAHILEQATVDGSYVTQKMSGPVALRGTLDPLRLSGDIRIDVRDHTTRTDSFRAPNPDIAVHVPRALVTGAVTITDEILDAKNLTVRAEKSQVTVDLMFNFPGFFWRLHARSSDFHLEDVDRILGFEVAGHGPLDCVIQGPIDAPHITGFGSFSDAVLEGMDFDSAQTSVDFRDLVLSFTELEARRNTSHITAEALVFDFNARGGLRIDTRIDARPATITDLMGIFNIDRAPWGNPTGALTGQVDLTYHLEPEQLFVEADVRHDALQVFGEAFGSDTLRVTWNDGDLIVHELGLSKGSGTVSVTGTIDRQSNLKLTGIASGVDLGAMNTEAVRMLDLNGKFQLFAVIGGTLDHPRGTIDLAVGNTDRKGTAYGHSNLRLTLNDTVLTGRGNLAGQKVDIEHLRIDMDKERFEVETFIKDLDVLPLMDIDAGGNDATLSVTGDLALRGGGEEGLRVSGHAELMQVSAKLNDITIKNQAPMKIAARDNRFRIGRTRFLGPDLVFDLGGTVSPEQLGLKVKGLSDLSSVSSLVDGITRTEGNLAFEVRATGSPGEPTFRGEAALTDGLVRLSAIPMDIKTIKGSITLTPKVIRFTDFSAETAGGTVAANGEMTLKGAAIDGYTFRLLADDLSLTPDEDLSLRASTVKNGLVLTSPEAGGLPTVTGNLEIRDLRFTEDIRFFQLSDLNVDQLSGARTSARKPKLLDPGKDFFTFDIRLHGDESIEAHNNLFDAELAIDDREKPLRFVGTNQSFGLLGRIIGKEGQVRFAGRRFEVKYAAIDFQDPDRPENPYFHVIADGKIRDWKVTLTAEGSVDEYELKFSSQPYLPKEDIAFLILTGLTQAENRQFNASALKLGMPLLGQFGPGGGELPVELQVYSEYSESAGKDTTKISMGRWITNDIWVSISSGVGQTRDVGAEVDYRINDAFSISADYEDEDKASTGNIGLDLKLRLEF